MSLRLSGVVGAPGIAIGPVAVLRAQRRDDEHVDGDPGERLRLAQAQVAGQLEKLATDLRAENKPDEAALFDAQALLATDPALVTQVEQQLAAGAPNLATALSQATEALASQLAALDDPYLRERAADVRGVGQQLLDALHGADLPDTALPEGSIVLAEELTPTQVMALRRRGMRGFASVHGTPTGHVALLARALDLPAVLGLDEALLTVADASPAILVATDAGQLIVEPSPAELARFHGLLEQHLREATARKALVGLPSVTADGHRVQLWANLGRPEEAEAALRLGAEGVGLFRTEFLFLDRDRAPSEDEQSAAYVQVLKAMGERPVVVRTLDIGGDKPLPYLPPLAEPNPFLGTRGIRFCMRHPDLFQAQLRALVRAAPAGNLRIMLPMVATPEDVAWARQRLAALGADVPLGIMVETPAAALTLDRLADGLQFCSIGSNDLAQYTLAVDRGDAGLARRYRPDDPAVFRLIRSTVASARRLGLEVSLCGELAADPPIAVALVGVGLEKLSMAPPALLEVKAALRCVTLDEARQAGLRALSGGSGAERSGPLVAEGAAEPAPQQPSSGFGASDV